MLTPSPRHPCLVLLPCVLLIGCSWDVDQTRVNKINMSYTSPKMLVKLLFPCLIFCGCAQAEEKALNAERLKLLVCSSESVELLTHRTVDSKMVHRSVPVEKKSLQQLLGLFSDNTKLVEKTRATMVSGNNAVLKAEKEKISITVFRKLLEIQTPDGKSYTAALPDEKFYEALIAHANSAK
jgi:hypothetical protein